METARDCMMVDVDSFFDGVELYPGGEGYTMSELEERTGKGREAIRKRLHMLVSAGKVRASRKVVKNLCGFPQRVASYVFEELNA